MLPRDLADFLISQGHDAKTAQRLKLSADALIWQYAEANGAVVITKDSDYLPLARHSTKTQLVHLTCGNMQTAELLDLFKKNMPQILEALASGERMIEVK